MSDLTERLNHIRHTVDYDDDLLMAKETSDLLKAVDAVVALCDDPDLVDSGHYYGPKGVYVHRILAALSEALEPSA